MRGIIIYITLLPKNAIKNQDGDEKGEGIKIYKLLVTQSYDDAKYGTGSIVNNIVITM